MTSPADEIIANSLTQALEASGAHVFEIGPAQVAKCGDGLRALFGVPPGTRFDYEVWRARLHPDDLARMEEDFARVAQEGGTTRIEYRVLLPDGTTRWLLTRAEAPQAVEAGSRRIVGVTLDITLQKTAEARLRMVLESTTDSVFSLSAEWRVTYLNKRAQDALLNGHNHLGSVVWDVFPNLVGGIFWQAYQRCMSERTPIEAEELYLPLNRLFAVRAFPAEDGGITVFFRDVTAHRQTSARLAEAETMLRALGEVSPDLLYAKDGLGRMVYANPATLAVIGRPAAEVIGRTEAEFLADPGQAAVVMQNDRRVLQAGTTELLEEIVTDSRTGLQRVWQCTKTPLRDPQTGEVVGIAGVSRDITDARSSDQALAESEARYRGTFENAAIGVAHVGLDGRWLRVNRRLCKLIGYSETELLQCRFQDITHADDVEANVAYARRLIQGEAAIYTMEKRYIRKDGSSVWVNLTVSLLRDSKGNPQHFISVVEDISSRKVAEASLADSEARFRAAVQAVSGIVWTNDAAGRMTGEQPGWAALTGQTFDEYQGYGWSGAVHPDDAQQTIEAWNRAVALIEPFVAEHRVRRHDGVWRHFAIRAIPVKRGDGSVREWVGVHTDITEQREAATVLARGRDELEQLVQARTSDLQQAQTRLAQAEKLSALGQLAGGIAHDFNNVMQVVQGGSNLLLRRPDNAASVRRLARMISEASQRGTSVTRRLLAFAHRGELRAGAVGIAELLEGLQEILAHTLGAGVTIQVQAQPDLPAALVDSSQLETALINLATNARDAMPNGGTITMTAVHEVVSGQAHEEGLLPGAYVRIAVTDTGTGIDKATLMHVLEPFFTTKPKGQGTGLGLSMARGFAQQSSGSLAIESEPGKGTTVTLWLPVAGPDVTGGQLKAANQTTIETHAVSRAPCILLVDDEDLVREVMAMQLRDEGYEVREVRDGLAALALLDGGESIDALVSDLAMPGMNGVALIQGAQIRRPLLPAILLTGYAGEVGALAINAGLRGNYNLLRKPITGSQLADRLAILLEATVSS